MLYIIALILILIALIKKDSKTVFYLIFFLLLLLLAGNIGNADQVSYKNNYDSIASGKPGLNFEFGFQLLCKICSFFGLTFNQFLLITALIGMVLIVSTIKLYTSNKAYVLALYFIYPFIWDTVQIRNFLAMSVIIFGSRYIISYKKEYIKYIICVLIASSLHITAVFYLTFLFILIKDTKKIVKVVILVTASSIIFMPILINYLRMLTTAEKINAYTLTQTSLVTKAAATIYFAVSILMVIIAKKIIDIRNQEENNQEGINTELISEQNKAEFLQIDAESILQINIICVLSLYFVINNLNFIRLYRNIFVLNYILFAVSLNKMKKTSTYYYFYWYAFILTMLSFLFLTLYVSNTNIFNPVFNNNIIFTWF